MLERSDKFLISIHRWRRRFLPFCRFVRVCKVPFILEEGALVYGGNFHSKGAHGTSILTFSVGTAIYCGKEGNLADSGGS